MARARTGSGAEIPVLGQGTWRMGEDARLRAVEIRALQLGLDLGMTLIDTAEMYGDGGAERIVADAIRGRRDGVFLVSKVLPHNASREGTVRAAERSLERLGTDRIDLYLLHWPGAHPIAETLEGFRTLVEGGKILHYGVSNFDADEMEELREVEAASGSDAVAANQVLYNLERRGIESRLAPWCRERGVVVMAYSPLGQGRTRRKPALLQVARRHGVSPECAMVAWTIREPGFVTIPKAVEPAHVRDNARAAELRLTAEDVEALDRAYPVPPRDVPLETL